MDQETFLNDKSFSARLLPAIRVLFLLNTALWLFRGISSMIEVFPITLEAGVGPLVIPAVMVGNSAAFLLASIGVSKNRDFYFYFAIILLLLNILLIALTEFGLWGIVALVLDLLLLALLPMLRPAPTSISGEETSL